ncbi:MAG: SGNH/GDSL hydrolase family protein [Leptolyngbya sp. BL-A-14]
MMKKIAQTVFGQLQTALATATLPLALVTLTPAVVHAAQFSNLYVFGDSLSDVGQFSAVTGGLVPPASLGYFDGRFSNGPVWVDYLATELGVPSTTQTNFAIGGASTGTQNSSIPGLPGLQQEIAGFTLTVPQADPDALYVIWAGANDYLGTIGQTNPTIPVSNIDQAITALAQVGAKDILVANLPDLGLVPLVSDRGPIVANAASALAQAHDTLLAQSLASLSSQLSPQGVTLIPFDVNSVFNGIAANPAQYGITNVTDPCLVNSPLFFSSGAISVCSNPDEYLFWDSLHPSTAAHQIVADAAFKTISGSVAGVPEPPTTAGLVVVGAFFAGLTALKQKRNHAPR